MVDFGAELETPMRGLHASPRQPARRDAAEQRIYLFIYRIRHRARPRDSDDQRFCAVLALGTSPSAAERIAINCVHQHGWHILRTDTATAIERNELEVGDDGAIFEADLAAFGTAFRLLGRA